MWFLDPNTERNLCPEEFQTRLTEAGGVNKYDEPNFRLAWGTTETFRAGGTWAPPGQPAYTGYRDLLASGESCWLFLMWSPAEKWGTPESYYVENWDPDTNLQTLGEYPYAGRYEIIAPLVHRYMKNGKPAKDVMPLNSLLLDAIIPIIFQCQDVSLAKRKEIFERRKEQDERDQLRDIEASLHSAHRTFGANPVSFAGQTNRTNIIDKKVESLQRNLNGAIAKIRQAGRGLSTHREPF